MTTAMPTTEPRSKKRGPLRRLISPLARWWLRSPHRARLTRALTPVVAGLQGTVLDVGGGREAPLDVAWPVNVNRFRVDLSDRIRPEILGDALTLPVATNSVDAVIACEVLEHVSDPGSVVAEAHRVLRDGGTLCGSVPFVMAVHADPHDYFRYTSDGLRVLLSDFEQVDIRPHGNHVSAAWRLLNIRFKWLLPLNPLIRGLTSRTNPRCPEGYTFVARR